MTLVLASGSKTRAQLLRDAGVAFEVKKPLVDEDSFKAALIAEAAKPRDIADSLAEVKARAVGFRIGAGHLVLGADQVIALGDSIFSKPQSPAELETHLKRLSGREHKILSAAVIYDGPRPVWRHISEARLFMRDLSDEFITNYVAQHYETVRFAAGGYHIEHEGAQLFDRIEGDYHAILGLPLLPVLNYLRIREVIPS